MRSLVIVAVYLTVAGVLLAQSTLPDPLRTLLSPSLPASPVSDGSIQIPGGGVGSTAEPALNSGVYVDPTMASTNETRAIHNVHESMTEFEQLVANAMGEQPSRFGRNLFTSEATTYAPADDTPVPTEARLAAGDELMVRIWGQLSFNGHLTVDRSGAIYIPQVGRIQVAGIEWEQIEEELHRQTARLYRNFEVSVTPGRLHSIRIYLLGEAAHPGSYTLSSLSTLVSALFVTGGPSSRGSMRRIELRRDGKSITTLDLYDLLLKADKSRDLSLLSGDVIFIPPVGPEVALLGSVRSSAIYELKGTEKFADLLMLAGGANVTASQDGLTLERVTEKKERETLRFTLGKETNELELHDGDIFYLAPMGLGYERTVTLRGNVANPGRYRWHPGMRLSELMPERAALVTRNYWQHRNRLGVPGRLIEEVKVSSTGSGKNLTGAIRKSGPDSTPIDEELSGNAIADASDEKPSESAPAESVEVKVAAPEIDWSYAVVERMDSSTLRNQLLAFSPGRLVLEKDGTQDLVLEAGDVVTIFSQKDIRVPQQQQTKYVRVEGEVARAGVYTVLPGETLRKLVERVGGTTTEAYLYGAEFIRESARKLQQQRLEEYAHSLSLEMERNAIKHALSADGITGTQQAQLQSQTNEQLARLHSVHASGRIVLHMEPTSTGAEALPELPLEDGDVLVIPPRPAVVNVIGSVYNQNSFLYEDGQPVKNYLTQAGGPSRIADRHHLFLVRADGSVVSQVEHREFESLILYPGDTLVVPEHLLKVSNTRSILDWTLLFSQMALGAAAINVLR